MKNRDVVFNNKVKSQEVGNVRIVEPLTFCSVGLLSPDSVQSFINSRSYKSRLKK